MKSPKDAELLRQGVREVSGNLDTYVLDPPFKRREERVPAADRSRALALPQRPV